MKKNLTSMLVIIMASLSVFCFSSYAGTPINKSELPKAAQTFLSKHFPNDNIRKVEKDYGRRGVEYEVDLSSGAEVDFRENGDWKEIKAAHGNTVPSALIPSAISKYVSTNYKGLNIIEIKRKRGGYEIELSNGTELKLAEDASPLKSRR